jgi:hypothetical protein
VDCLSAGSQNPHHPVAEKARRVVQPVTVFVTQIRKLGSDGQFRREYRQRRPRPCLSEVEGEVEGAV